jgi:hypothetical protein
MPETADTAKGIPKDRTWLPLLGNGVWPRVKLWPVARNQFLVTAGDRSGWAWRKQGRTGAGNKPDTAVSLRSITGEAHNGSCNCSGTSSECFRRSLTRSNVISGSNNTRAAISLTSANRTFFARMDGCIKLVDLSLSCQIWMLTFVCEAFCDVFVAERA